MNPNNPLPVVGDYWAIPSTYSKRDAQLVLQLFQAKYEQLWSQIHDRPAPLPWTGMPLGDAP